MLDSELEYRLRRLGMNAHAARRQTAKVRDLYFPAAIVARETFDDPASPLGCACLGTLGINMQSTGSTVSLAATGAKAGSMIMPGIGTAIGAAVGIVYAALKHILGNKDVRTSGAQKGECSQFLGQYLVAAQQAGPLVTLGPQLGLDNLEKIMWCFSAVYGGPVYNVDPRFFTIGWQQASDYAKQLTNAAFSKPPGSSFTSTATTGYSTDRKHSDTRPPATVRLPMPLTIAALADLCTTYMIASCSNKNKYASNCPPYWRQPVAQRLLFDLCGYWINQQFPQVFAPPVVTATPAVVQQAGTIVARTGTTTVINPATGQPVTVPLVSTTGGNTTVTDPVTGRVIGGGVAYYPTGNPTIDAVGDQMSRDGVNMNSPEAKQILSDVAAEGVVQTPAGPVSPMKAGMGIGAAVLLGLLFLGGKKNGH